jgi:hypothetical protein
MLFLDKKVNFQGAEIELRKIVKTDDVGLLNVLDFDSLSLLLENGKSSLGVSTVNTIEYYIDRTLQFRKHANTPLPAQGEMQPGSRRDIFQEIRDNCLHMEENLRSKTKTFWKPRTLLERDGQILMVTDEPGMGKSTLLTHLANETRKLHPEI